MIISRVYYIFLVSTIFLVHTVFAKRYITRPACRPPTEITKEYINSLGFFKIVPLNDILSSNPQILYSIVCPSLYFDYPRFLVAPNFPHAGYFDELFILNIPHGIVCGQYGHVCINNQIAQELIWKQKHEYLNGLQVNNLIKKSGKVAVIAQSLWANYYHFIYEFLGRLALLEIQGIEYDWLYVPYDKKFIQEALDLWGIDSSKIIACEKNDLCIQADELIVPSLVTNTSLGHYFAGQFVHPLVMNYVRTKLLHALEQKNLVDSSSSKKIFISRKDGNFPRKIINEDEVFALFEAQGFKRYVLSSMSVVEQINLFAHADVVVSEHGAGLSNILFCKPKTKIVEIFHTLIDNAYWMTSQTLGLQYLAYQAISVDTKYFENYKEYFLDYAKAGRGQTVVSLEIIQNIINMLEESDANF